MTIICARTTHFAPKFYNSATGILSTQFTSIQYNVYITEKAIILLKQIESLGK